MFSYVVYASSFPREARVASNVLQPIRFLGAASFRCAATADRTCSKFLRLAHILATCDSNYLDVRTQ